MKLCITESYVLRTFYLFLYSLGIGTPSLTHVELRPLTPYKKGIENIEKFIENHQFN